MRLIDSIVSTHNINEAIYRVKSNKDSIIESILNKTYKPQVGKKSIYTEI